MSPNKWKELVYRMTQWSHQREEAEMRAREPELGSFGSRLSPGSASALPGSWELIRPSLCSNKFDLGPMIWKEKSPRRRQKIKSIKWILEGCVIGENPGESPLGRITSPREAEGLEPFSSKEKGTLRHTWGHFVGWGRWLATGEPPNQKTWC